MEQFTVYNISSETISLFKACFDKNGSPKNEERINWQFLSNNQLPPIVDILHDVDKNCIAGIFALSTVRFKIGTQIVIGAQSLDTLTDSNYRGLGLFIKMAKDVQFKAQNQGVSLIYGFPNGKSFPGFRKLLKWQVLDPLPFLIKPLKTKYFVRKFKLLNMFPNIKLSYAGFKKDGNFVLRAEKTFPEAVDAIWGKFSSRFRVSVIRDKSYLTWRYLDKPGENYKIVHCYSNKGHYIGYVIYTVKEKHDGIIGYIMEFIYDPDIYKAGKLLLDFAIEDIRNQNADCILAWCLQHSPNYSLFKKNIFVNMPEKIRPIELHFAARAIDRSISSLVNNRTNWYISYSDSDTV